MPIACNRAPVSQISTRAEPFPPIVLALSQTGTGMIYNHTDEHIVDPHSPSTGTGSYDTEQHTSLTVLPN